MSLTLVPLSSIAKFTGWPMLMFDRNVSTEPSKVIQSFAIMVGMLIFVVAWIFVEKGIKEKILKK